MGVSGFNLIKLTLKVLLHQILIQDFSGPRPKPRTRSDPEGPGSDEVGRLRRPHF